ncbi:MAG: zinc carboxypeptidase [Bacteroidetes bacterium]|nr:MAG: zinc carboxypeptidase [Bacteroidota bacterium]
MQKLLVINLSYIFKLLFFLFLLAFPFTLTAQQKKTVNKEIEERGEVYLLVNIPNQRTLNKLIKVSSIDKQAYSKNGNKVYAYVSRNQIKEFEDLKLNYSLQTPPSLKLAAAMCPDIDGVKNWDCYPTYNQYISLMNEFVTNFPDLCQLEEIGKSVDGRRVLSIKISDNVSQDEEEPAFFYTSTMHGDEVTGYVLMLRLIDYLLNNYQSDTRVKELIDSTEIWINPLANPDGTYSAGNLSITGATRNNANNYDLNRNFPDPEDGEFPGGTRQLETQDMMDFMVAHNFTLSANFHGGTEVVNYPWDTWYTRHADDTWYQDLSRQYADTVHANRTNYMTGYTDGITNGADWYLVSGGRQDYANYYLHSRETTIEISMVKIPDASTLPALWNYNYRSFLNYIDRVQYGLYGKIVDVEGNPVKAKIFIENHDMDSSDIFSDKDNGMYYRLIMGGTYNITFSAEGYITKTINDISFLDTERKRLDVILEKETVSIYDFPKSSICIKTINNPFNNYISANIDFSDYLGEIQIMLYDANGRLHKKEQLNNLKTGLNSIYMTTNELSSGSYILQIQTKLFTINEKLIKQ